MKIECKQKRKGGTKIELFGKEYHFKPEDAKLKPDDPLFMEVAHICDVDDDSAIHRLCVGIKEGYAPVDPKAMIPKPTRVIEPKVVMNSKTGEPVEPPKPVVIEDGDGNKIELTAMEPEELRKLARETFQINVHSKWPDQVVIAKIVEKTRGQD